MQPGFIFKREYLVAPVYNAVQAIEDGTLKVIRAKRVELIEGQFVFPLDPEQIKHDEAFLSLDDQNINNAPPGTNDELDDALQLMDDYLGPGGLDDEGGKANARRKARPMKQLNRLSPRSLLQILLVCSITPSIRTAPRCLLATIGMASGWLGIRRVLRDLLTFRRNFGTCIPRNNEKKKLKEWEKKVAKAEAAKREELEKEAPAMPVLLNHKEPHRPKYESNMERMHNLYLDKLEQTADELYALVAKVIKSERCCKDS